MKPQTKNRMGGDGRPMACEYASMAGHSKWANLKHKKGVNDTRRGNRRRRPEND